jgi:aarF domain-containing kinase
MMNLPRATETFGYVLFLQADLINEAKNLNQFRSNFYRESKTRQDESSIVFPQPIQGWSSPKVIVEDYVHDAIPISDFIQDSSAEGIAIRKELAGPLLRAFLKMVFIDNFVSPVRVANIPFYLKSKLTFHCCCTGAR